LKELIDHIPFVDVIIVAVLIAFLVVGWANGAPRMIMALISLYAGFLLASVYYHLFATALGRTFNMKANFVADVIAFLVLFVMISALMMALMIGLFGHIEIKGRLGIFDKVFGTLAGFAAGLLVIGVVVTLLHVPYNLHQQSLNSSTDVPIIKLFNQGYDLSALAPVFVKGAPFLTSTIVPMLPPEARGKGTIPLLEGITAQK